MATADPAAEQQAYRKAFDLLKSGKFSDASAALTQFLKEYPNGRFADNAQYWLGESHYVSREFGPALKAFEQLLVDYPDSPKRSHAMLKIGFIHDEQGRKDQAREVLTELVRPAPPVHRRRPCQQAPETAAIVRGSGSPSDCDSDRGYANTSASGAIAVRAQHAGSQRDSPFTYPIPTGMPATVPMHPVSAPNCAPQTMTMLSFVRNWFARHFSDPQVVGLAIVLLVGIPWCLLRGPHAGAGDRERHHRLPARWPGDRGGATQTAHGFRPSSSVFSLFMAGLLFFSSACCRCSRARPPSSSTACPRWSRSGQDLLLTLPERYPDLVTEDQVREIISAHTPGAARALARRR